MRPSNATYGGSSYQFCKGRIEDDETSIVAAVREATEELGIVPWMASSKTEFVSRIMNSTCDLFVCEYNFMSSPASREETIHTAFLSEKEFMAIGRDWQKPICQMVVKFINEQATS